VTETEIWYKQLSAWIDLNGLCGFDPFDVKQHYLIRATQRTKWARRATTLLTDMFPYGLRKVLHVSKTENPKAHALVALASLRCFELKRDEVELLRAQKHLDWLLQNSNREYAGLSWGYPFDVHGAGVQTPKRTPIGVVCSIAGEAFSLAYELTRQSTYANAVEQIATHFLQVFPRIESSDGTYCFGYTPKDLRRVHNANLHVAEHLFRTFRLTGDETYSIAAAPALEFTLRRQREDGAWSYGEWNRDEPFEKGLMEIVDHHHTGFVLRSLHAIDGMSNELRVATQLRRGFAYYREHLFTQNGMPIHAYAKYPVDIHACAEGILCPSLLSNCFDDAFQLAHRCLHWTSTHMVSSEGLPYYRAYPWFTSRLMCTRWGLAWLYRALSEYIIAESRSRDQSRTTRQLNSDG
jgi:hypothetical protein